MTQRPAIDTPADLVTCKQCYAAYKPGQKWVRGHYLGTSTNFIAVEELPEGRCPVCGKKEDQ